MALTRNLLKSIGLNDEQINMVIEAHTETTDGLKNERDQYKTAHEELEKAKAEVKRLTSEVEKLNKSATDTASVQKAFDDYKAKVEKDTANTNKSNALRKLFRDNGVQRDQFVDLLLGTIQLDSIELDGEKVKGADELVKNTKATYADLFATSGKQGLPETKPLNNGNGGMTKDAFLKLPLSEQMQFANDHPQEYAALK